MSVDVFRKLTPLWIRAHIGDLPSQHQSLTVDFLVRLLEASETQPNLSTEHDIMIYKAMMESFESYTKCFPNSSQKCIFYSQAVAFRALQLPLSEAKVEKERKQTSWCLGKYFLSVLLRDDSNITGRKVVPSV